ncbi:AAA family ATPase [Caulobacter sp.]|uniref:AAA family ATPase n=1 Tax=Caulobacter sp. TaxID=78 RepID=UPI003BACC93B
MLFPTYENWLSKLWQDAFFEGDTEENLRKRYKAQRERAMPFRGGWAEMTPPTANEWLIDGLIPKQGYALAYGNRGTGKTFVALDMASSGALGLPFLGFSVPKPFGSAFFVGEKQTGFGKRPIAWSMDRGVSGAPPFVWFTAGVPVLLDDASVAKTIAYLNEEVRPQMEDRGLPLEAVFIDTLARAVAGASVSEQSIASRGTDAIARIADGAGVSVIMLAHVAKAKAGVHQDATAKGAGEWEDAAETVIKLDRAGTSPVRTLTVTKQSDGVDGCKAAYELHPVEVGRDSYGRLITSCVIKPSTLPTRQAKGKSPHSSASEILGQIEAMIAAGASDRYMPKGPDSSVGSAVTAISLKALRERLVASGFRSSLRPPPGDAKAYQTWLDSCRKTLDRGLASLVETSRIERDDERIWIPTSGPD